MKNRHLLPLGLCGYGWIRLLLRGFGGLGQGQFVQRHWILLTVGQRQQFVRFPNSKPNMWTYRLYRLELHVIMWPFRMGWYKLFMTYCHCYPQYYYWNSNCNFSHCTFAAERISVTADFPAETLQGFALLREAKLNQSSNLNFALHYNYLNIVIMFHI